ncbi:uncharacterized protein BT62DRAFT_928667 [Guyanagaster necrorhizus]|uniref:Uncharacterized protein n=1 Tax=Guyanagaster necrorhizus TaxID=856835 RepID=A0A9P7W0V3_9AGAR|nr:uncharacterized protein BT62DRAFT_928667 [Guyanagaster necrorhizus MCA 3950]KAG7449909.1 hypothetical protein BT62DRAFT_928667 [Guyanagaster necrorhizus MCA 3950]
MLHAHVLAVYTLLRALYNDILSLCPQTTSMLSLQWLLKALQRAFRNYPGGCSLLKAIISFWVFLKRRLRGYSRAFHDKMYAKGPRPINDQASSKLRGEKQKRCIDKFPYDGDVEKPTSVVATQDSPPIFSLPDLSSLPDSSPASEGHSVPNAGPSGHLNSTSHCPQGCPPSAHAARNFNGAGPTTSTDVRPLPPIPIQDEVEETNNLLGRVPGSPTTLSVIYPSFWPLAPEQIQRYEREVFITLDETMYWIDPLTTLFPPHRVQDGWVPFVHPEGALYWFHQAKRSFTGVNLCDREKLQHITKFMDDIYEYIRVNAITIPENVDLVFELVRDPDNDEQCCAYYFASHDTRSVFWLDDFDMSYPNTWDEVKGVTEPSHVGLEIEAQYWYHCQLFPTCMEMTMGIIEELRDILIYNMGDTMTSPLSTSVYGVSELQEIIGLTNCIEKSITSGRPQRPGSVGSIGRFMFIFLRNRFINFHGQPGARLARDQLIYGTPSKRTLLVSFLSPFLFFAPDINLATLKRIGGDGYVHTHKASWSNFTDKLSAEWQEVTLYATVLLPANVAFLAIQSVDDASANGGRSPAQISSYVSMIASIGSIFLSTRMRAHDSSKDSRFLRLRKRNNRSMEILAIMYSLPTALLMWAMVFFLVAFSIVCFTASSLSDRMLVGGAWILIGVLILWCSIVFLEVKHVYVPYMSKLAVLVKYWDRLPINLAKRFHTHRMKTRPPMSSVDEAAVDV